MASSSIVVRYFLLPKKFVKLDPEVFIPHAKALGIEFLPYDTEKPYSEQPCHILLNKLTDYMVEPDTEKSKQVLAHFETLRSLKEGPVLVNGIDCQWQVLSRQQLADTLNRVEMKIDTSHNIQCPRTVRVTTQEECDSLTSSLSFPRIVKTEQACGSAESHMMKVVLDKEAFSRLKAPMLVQEYFNHNATVYKVFVLGNEVQTVRRPSLPDFRKSDVDGCKDGVFAFDSQHMPKGGDQYKTAAAPPEETVKAVANMIKQETGMSLFGFDMITNSETRKHAVIDVNYFPSYRGFPDFHTVLCNYLWDCYREGNSSKR